MTNNIDELTTKLRQLFETHLGIVDKKFEIKSILFSVDGIHYQANCRGKDVIQVTHHAEGEMASFVKEFTLAGIQDKIEKGSNVTQELFDFSSRIMEELKDPGYGSQEDLNGAPPVVVHGDTTRPATAPPRTVLSLTRGLRPSTTGGQK